MRGRRIRCSTSARRSSAVALLAAAALTSLAASCPPMGSAQSGSVPRVLAGTWVHDGDIAGGTRTIDAAFAPSLAAFPELFRGFARDRLRGSLPPPRRVVVSLDGSRVRVRLDADRATTIDGPLGATATTSGVEDGTRVTSRLQGGWLELRYVGEGSEMRQLFSTEPDGSRMHVDYTVQNPRLAGPVRFRLEYVRAPR